MMWTKLGVEFSDHARDLTDAEFRTHAEALLWSNRRGLDLHIPKRDHLRFAESPDVIEAITGLVVKGWWEDRGDAWYIGVHFPEWQLEHAVVEKRRNDAALRKRRQRLHQAGEHSLCLDGHCPDVTRDVGANVTRDGMRDKTRDPVRNGTGTTSPAVPLKDQDQNREADSSIGSEADDPAGRADLNPLRGKAAKTTRLHHGSEDPTSDDQQIPVPVTLQSPAADRNAREHTAPLTFRDAEADRARERERMAARMRKAPA